MKHPAYHALLPILLALQKTLKAGPIRGVVLIDSGIVGRSDRNEGLHRISHHTSAGQEEEECPLVSPAGRECQQQSNQEPCSQSDQKGHHAVYDQGQNQARYPEAPIQQFPPVGQNDQQKDPRHDQKDGHVNTGGEEPQIGDQNQEFVTFGTGPVIHPDERQIDHQQHQEHGEPIHLGLHRIGPEGHGECHEEAPRDGAHVASQPYPQAGFCFPPSAGQLDDHQIGQPDRQGGGQNRDQVHPGGDLVEDRHQS